MNEKLEQLNDFESCDYEYLFDDVNDLICQSRVNEALDLLKTIPKNHEDYPIALYMQSLCLYDKCDEENSFKLFQEALSLKFGNSNHNRVFGNKDDSEELFLFALTLIYVFEDYTKALEYLDLSLNIKPNQCEAFHFKAICFGFLGKYKKAIKLINKAIKLNPNNSTYWNNKGTFLLEMNYVSKALRAFDRAIRIKPNPDSWSNKGTLYYRMGKLDEALTCYTEAIKLDPLDISSIVNKASIHSELGEVILADGYFKMAEKLDGNDFSYLVEMGKHLLNKGEFLKSIEFLDRSIKINEDFALPWMYKSMALSELGRDEESEICFKKAIDLDPDSIQVFDEVIVIED